MTTLKPMIRTAAQHLFYPVALALGLLLVAHAAEADRLLRLAANMQSLAGSARMAWVSMLERLSFDWYSGARELGDAYQAIMTDAGAAQMQAHQLALGLVLLFGCHLALLLFLGPRRPEHLAWHFNLAAVPALLIGLSAPMLTVVANSSVPVLGEIVLKHETKTILSTISDLLANEQFLLGLLIAIFSVIVPVSKIVLLMIALSPVTSRLRVQVHRFISAVGKWSMADVFVVAVLIAFLAFEKDVHSRADLGLGLYFFSAYCALSLFATQLAQRAGDKDLIGSAGAKGSSIDV